MKRSPTLAFEQLETKLLPTLVFVFNGNGFAESKPDQNTQIAADLVSSHGNRAIQLATPAMDGPAAFYQLARRDSSDQQGPADRPDGL